MPQLTEWEQDCLKWHREVLKGEFAHWCFDWDGLPIDETMSEFLSCNCTFEPPELEAKKAGVVAAMREEKCSGCKGAGGFVYGGGGHDCMQCGGSGLMFQ
jgi:hypothetical protein